MLIILVYKRYGSNRYQTAALSIIEKIFFE